MGAWLAVCTKRCGTVSCEGFMACVSQELCWSDWELCCLTGTKLELDLGCAVTCEEGSEM